MNLAAACLLELHCAAAPFLRRRTIKDAADRERLRRAIFAVLHDAGAIVPADLISTDAEALEALRQLIARMKAMNTRWNEVVAIVNREPADAA